MFAPPMKYSTELFQISFLCERSILMRINLQRASIVIRPPKLKFTSIK